VVHYADPHLDLFYQEGAIADCKPSGGYCCRNNTYTGYGTVKAGKFGAFEYRCDPPFITYQNMLDYIKNTIKPDMIVWTGDNSPHDDAYTSLNETLESTKQLAKAL
jgi:hypothetical protein